jgi:RNA polymerase sigma-70 factor (ECF subfamily)
VDTDSLLDLASAGDQEATRTLLERHRDRLRRMVGVRLDRRLAPRLDASDIVQEALAEAATKLVQYARQRPVAFYPWLRQIAWQHLVMNYRHHALAQRRSIAREIPPDDVQLSDSSRMELADRLLSPQASPSTAMMRDELKRRVLQALDALSTHDREVLVLHYLEQLTMREVADVIGISETAAHNRHTRALLRLRKLLSSRDSEL